MSPNFRYLESSEASGILEGWVGPVEEYGCDDDFTGFWQGVAWPGFGCENTRRRLDCDRPETRDRMARWIASKVGLKVDTTAPAIVPVTTPSMSVWMVVIRAGVVKIFHDDPERMYLKDHIRVPGISRVSDPGRALVAICRHLGKETA
mgnify:CR=1 FL=1|jgi:hypothetical protein